MIETSGPRIGRSPEAYLRFMYTPSSGLRRIVRSYSQVIPSKDGPREAADAVFRRSVEVEPNLRTILAGTQVSLAPNFAAAAMTVLTNARFFNPGDFSDSFAPVRKWDLARQEEVGQQMIFTRSVPLDRAGIGSEIRAILGSATEALPPVMWDHLGNYLVPLLPGKVLGPVCYYSGKCAAAEAIHPVAGIAGAAEAIAYLKTNHEPNTALSELLLRARLRIEGLLLPPAVQPVEISLEDDTAPISLTAEGKK